MALKLSPEMWESYWLSERCERLVTCHQQHAVRVAEILSQRFPGVIFLWDEPYQKMANIHAVLPTRRQMKEQDIDAMSAAAEAIAGNVGLKHGVKRWFVPKLRRGWHYTEAPTASGKATGAIGRIVRLLVLIVLLALCGLMAVGFLAR